MSYRELLNQYQIEINKSGDKDIKKIFDIIIKLKKKEAAVGRNTKHSKIY